MSFERAQGCLINPLSCTAELKWWTVSQRPVKSVTARMKRLASRVHIFTAVKGQKQVKTGKRAGGETRPKANDWSFTPCCMHQMVFIDYSLHAMDVTVTAHGSAPSCSLPQCTWGQRQWLEDPNASVLQRAWMQPGGVVKHILQIC